MACSSSDNETQGGALNQLIGHMTMTSGNNIASTVDGLEVTHIHVLA